MDQLNRDSRSFYERALLKRVASLMLAAIGMMFMGFTAEAGSLATVNNLSYASSSATTEAKAVYSRRGSGYGFSCFVYLMASLVGIAMAVYISPDTASENEKRILTNPVNVYGSSPDPERGAGSAPGAISNPDTTVSDDDYY